VLNPLSLDAFDALLSPPPLNGEPGLLPGAPIPTRTEHPPAGLDQLPGRNMMHIVFYDPT
jgi:hypothetical protein